MERGEFLKGEPENHGGSAYKDSAVLCWFKSLSIRETHPSTGVNYYMGRGKWADVGQRT
jgi:hypothetical protein